MVHLVLPVDPTSADRPPRAGFVVSRAVGNAVTRNRVQRRLRHLVREHLPALPGGTVLVVRALPPAASASSAELASALGRCLARAGAPVASPSNSPGNSSGGSPSSPSGEPMGRTQESS